MLSLYSILFSLLGYQIYFYYFYVTLQGKFAVYDNAVYFLLYVCVCVYITMGLAQSVVIGRKLSIGEQNKNKDFKFETESN
jgi:Ca2+/Na+ antiporter